MGIYGSGLKEADTWAVLDAFFGMDVLYGLAAGRYTLDRTTTAETLTRILALRGATMAKTQGKTAESGDSQWTRFVDIPFVGYTKEDVNDRYGSWDDFHSDLAALLSSGYRVGVSYSEKQSAFIVSVTCRDAASPNHGCTFSSFARDWLTALQVALFKHFVIVSEVWSSPTPAAGDDYLG